MNNRLIFILSKDSQIKFNTTKLTDLFDYIFENVNLKSDDIDSYNVTILDFVTDTIINNPLPVFMYVSEKVLEKL